MIRYTSPMIRGALTWRRGAADMMASAASKCDRAAATSRAQARSSHGLATTPAGSVESIPASFSASRGR